MRRFGIPAALMAPAVGLLAALAFGIAHQGPNNSIAYSVASHRYRLPPDDRAQLPVIQGGDGARTRSLADYRGRVVLVNYFASWCGGCSEEAPLMGRLQKLMAARGGTVLAVAEDGSTGDALTFLHRYRDTFPALDDVGSNLIDAFGQNTYPDSYLIARDGRIVALNTYPLTMGWIRQFVIPVLDRRA